MPNLFNSVQGLRPRLRSYNLSHGYQFTTDIGLIVPVFIRDCVPGSVFRIGAHNLTRLSALLSPAMDDINLYVHLWKIPRRLLDSDFNKWIGGEITDEDYDPPYFTPKGFYDALVELDDMTITEATGPGSLWDMCGFPNTFVWSTDKTQYPLCWFSWYAMLLLHWYTNENIKTPSAMNALLGICTKMCVTETREGVQGDCSFLLAQFFNAIKSAYHYGAAASVTNTFACHAWSKDYFTSALPFVQKGDPVSIPLTGSAPVEIPASKLVNIGVLGSGDYQGQILLTSNSILSGDEQLIISEDGTTQGAFSTAGDGGVITHIQGDLATPLTGSADLSESSAININELRVLNALQVFKERQARFGSRYVEYLKGFFNVTSKDARLQLPEWLGGGKCPITISEIAQTSATGSTGTPQGNLAGKGVGFAAGFAGTKKPVYCDEHCLIVGVAWLQPAKSKYAGQGVDKHRSKLRDIYDFFNPSFEHLGEQEIDVRELYAGAASKVFGYTPRYAEYRFWPNEVHGLFKSSLSYWSTARIFSEAPSLNSDFVYIQPDPIKRIYATTGEDNHVLVDMYWVVQSLQPMSKYGTPMLLN